jgi:hypothetical protein
MYSPPEWNSGVKCRVSVKERDCVISLVNFPAQHISLLPLPLHLLAKKWSAVELKKGSSSKNIVERTKKF